MRRCGCATGRANDLQTRRRACSSRLRSPAGDRCSIGLQVQHRLREPLQLFADTRFVGVRNATHAPDVVGGHRAGVGLLEAVETLALKPPPRWFLGWWLGSPRTSRWCPPA